MATESVGLPAMTPEEFKGVMQEIAEGGDPEVARASAEEVICTLLQDLGYGEGVEIFQNLHRWYDATPDDIEI